MPGTPTAARNLDGYGAPLIEWERVREVLDGEITQAPGTGGPGRHTAWLSTIEPDGRPQVRPLGVISVDGTWYFTSGPGTRKPATWCDPCCVSRGHPPVDIVVRARRNGSSTRRGCGRRHRLRRPGLAGGGPRRADRRVQRPVRRPTPCTCTASCRRSSMPRRRDPTCHPLRTMPPTRGRRGDGPRGLGRCDEQARSSPATSAPAVGVYRALLDRRRLGVDGADGMTSPVHTSPREGGEFRISLTYDSPSGTGKTDSQTDTYHGRFARLIPDTEVVQVIEFETADPAMQGEMTVTYTLAEADGGTLVSGRHDDLPPGVSPEDNELGWSMSIGKLARLVESDA